MENLPVHMRIAMLTPSNEDVDSRKAAITALSSKWGKLTQIADILAKAEMIAASLGGDGQPAESLGMEVQNAVQKKASAFLFTESPLEVGICAGVAALSILQEPHKTSGWTTVDVYSNALWSSLGFQPPLQDEKREKLRQEVLELAQKRSREAADKVRERKAVPDMADLTVTLEEGEEETKTETNFKKASGATIEALRRNAALDREELDFLWWVQLSRSRLLNRQFASMPEPLRLVTSGIEAANQLRRLPADLHYELVLRTVEDDPEIDLPELIEIIGDDRAELAGAVNTTRIAQHPTIFPFLHALSTGEAGGVAANEKRKASTWAGRALLEAGLNRMCENGLMKL